jgi:tRNA modification GTPase
MEFCLDDTIAAPGSAPGPAARAVVRVSGPAAQAVLSGLFAPVEPDRWNRPHGAARRLGILSLDSAGIRLPAAVYLWPTPRSVTGQPLGEVHLVGSPPIVAALLEELYARGARPARAGEFTLRAFLAGRIDLLQAEAVLGVIDAPDDHALRTALAQLAGGVSARLAEVHERLLLDLADLEAGLDFVEEDIAFISRGEFRARLDATAELLQHLLQQAHDRMPTHAVPRVVLAGRPNAGKSTLFNALVGRAAALVSPTRGTTRDYLTAGVVWHGIEVELVDTAGVETTREDIMVVAGSARERLLATADVVLWCHPADASAAEQALGRQQRDAAAGERAAIIDVVTKADVGDCGGSPAELAVSARTGERLDELAARVVACLNTRRVQAGELLGSTAARCRDSLRQALAAIQQARRLSGADAGDELISVELREALDHLGQIVGRVYTDDLLDRIFSRFCIGK